MIKKPFQLSALLIALTLTGCETPSIIRNDAPQVVASPDSVSLMLANAADKASTALETLAAIEQFNSPSVATAPPVNVPTELNRAVTIDWLGPVEQISKTLADQSGYRFVVLGDVPPVPVVVDIDVENRPIIEVMRNIGLQLGRRADLRLDSQRRVVELFYAPVSGL
jgi:defect-in-organelle-trafficking protein DotD